MMISQTALQMQFISFWEGITEMAKERLLELDDKVTLLLKEQIKNDEDEFESIE